MTRERDAARLSDFDPDELLAVERGLVAVGYELKDGMLTLTVSQSRVCGLAAIARLRRRVGGDGLKHRLDAWREVHIPPGANVVDGLVRVLRPQSS